MTAEEKAYCRLSTTIFMIDPLCTARFLVTARVLEEPSNSGTFYDRIDRVRSRQEKIRFELYFVRHLNYRVYVLLIEFDKMV